MAKQLRNSSRNLWIPKSKGELFKDYWLDERSNWIWTKFVEVCPFLQFEAAVWIRRVAGISEILIPDFCFDQPDRTASLIVFVRSKSI